jgi:hypothetical protein
MRGSRRPCNGAAERSPRAACFRDGQLPRVRAFATTGLSPDAAASPGIGSSLSPGTSGLPALERRGKTVRSAALPVYFDNDFYSVIIDNGSQVAIVWLIPITSAETVLVQVQG